MNHAKVLIGLIDTFPTDNPDSKGQGEGEGDKEVDMTGLLAQIRARYRLLCTSVGARARLVAASGGGGEGESGVEGVEGPVKGVDMGMLKY